MEMMGTEGTGWGWSIWGLGGTGDEDRGDRAGDEDGGDKMGTEKGEGGMGDKIVGTAGKVRASCHPR